MGSLYLPLLHCTCWQKATVRMLRELVKLLSDYIKCCFDFIRTDKSEPHLTKVWLTEIYVHGIHACTCDVMYWLLFLNPVRKAYIYLNMLAKLQNNKLGFCLRYCFLTSKKEIDKITVNSIDIKYDIKLVNQNQSNLDIFWRAFSLAAPHLWYS